MRGILDFIVEVRTLDHAVHGGTNGGPVPDALMALSRLIASLHDDRGNVIIEGLQSGPPYDIEVDEAHIRQFASVRPGVSLMGTGTLAHRLWGRPAVPFSELTPRPPRMRPTNSFRLRGRKCACGLPLRTIRPKPVPSLRSISLAGLGRPGEQR